MKYLPIALLIILISCQANSNKVDSYRDISDNKINGPYLRNPGGLYSWTGNIGSNIPVFIWIVVKDSIIQGQVTYTKAKNSVPIKLLGQISKDGEVRINEFQNDGNITGVFVLTKLENDINGIWASTKTDKELNFKLFRKDTLIQSMDTLFEATNIPGEYAYSYGVKGSQGGLSVNLIENNKISFGISAVTRDPSRNIAQIETDTVTILNNGFIYKVPDSDSCIFKVKFYKNFVLIDYVKDYGDCGNVFGLNSGVDGIFFKIMK